MAARCGFRNRYLDWAQVRYVCLNRVLPVEARQQDYHRLSLTWGCGHGCRSGTIGNQSPKTLWTME